MSKNQGDEKLTYSSNGSSIPVMAVLEIQDCNIATTVKPVQSRFGLTCNKCLLREGGTPTSTTIGNAVESTVYCAATACLNNLQHQQARSRKG